MYHVNMVHISNLVMEVIQLNPENMREVNHDNLPNILKLDIEVMNVVHGPLTSQ